MSGIVTDDRSVVVPGDLIAEGMDYLPGQGTYKNDEEVRSNTLGLVRVKSDSLVSVIPLAGKYMPQSGDGVIGIVDSVQSSAWMVDIDTPYQGYLSLSEGVEEFVDLDEEDLTDYFDVGDVLYCKIDNVSKRKDIRLTMKDRICRKLEGGNTMKVTPAKVPRLIGRGGSMIELIKGKTDCHIIVGQNGIVWLEGENEELAVDAIRMVEEQSHVKGLTDRVSDFLDKHTR